MTHTHSPTSPATARLEEVQTVIDYIRPAIQADGGDIELLRIEGTRVVVRLLGACVGCSMASVTLLEGVERLVVEWVPWVTAVEPETDPESVSQFF